MPDSSSDPAHDAISALYRQEELVEALKLARSVLDAQDRDVDARVSKARFHLALRCATRMGAWDQVETVARQSIARHRSFAAGHRVLGEALLRLGRPAEAIGPLETSLALAPNQDEARTLLQAARDGGLAKRPPVRAWPSNARHFEDPEAFIRRHMLRNLRRGGFIAPGVRMMTMGSCFAGNLALRLKAAGYEVAHEAIGEEINSTFANRYMLEWLEGGPLGPQAEMIRSALGEPMGERMRKALETTDVFVLTLGVGLAFFDRHTGAFAYNMYKSATAHDEMYARTVMRPTTVAENVDNLLAVIAAIRRISRRDPHIVVTISPVPLAGATDVESIVTADALSKSTLLVACHEALAALGDARTYYWPSFEMVRWLGAYYPPGYAAYAADDSNTRHVSDWLVELIIDLFLEHHGRAAGASGDEAGEHAHHADEAGDRH